MEIAATDENSVQQSTTRGPWSTLELSTIVDYFFNNRNNIVTLGKQIYDHARVFLKGNRSYKAVRHKIITVSIFLLINYNDQQVNIVQSW